MNYASRNVRAIPAISLAEEADFSLGPLLVRPSARQVRIGERSETIEPRVMQVLVLLASAIGAVVSREQLVDRCWGGRIVGDDAVNNAIVKVRALAALSEQPAFEIETIPRVGYRLRVLQVRNGTAGEISSPKPAFGSLPLKAGYWRSLRGFAAGLLLAAALAAGAYYSLHREPQWTIAESQLPFIATPAIERYPALSPDGTMIAYSAGSNTYNRHIFLRLIKSGDPIQLTHDPYDASSPAWTSDGRAIAYVIFQPGHPCRIMEVPIPAGQSRQVGQCRFCERSSVAFDHDGDALFFADALARGAGGRIFKLDLNNGHVSMVTHPDSGDEEDGSASVSPDGRALLYNRDIGGTESQVRLLSLSDGVDRRVAAIRAGGDLSATFAPDGRTIFLARSLDSDNSLWAYPLGGGGPSRILSTGEYIGRLSAAANGLLAMEMRYPGGQLVAVTPHSDTAPKSINSGGLRTWCVDYASDGTFLATGWRAESFGIWVSAPGESLRQLIGLPNLACAIRWSPDGTRFAFIEPQGNGFDVPVMTRGGAAIARLHFAGRDSGLLDWTADGKSILTSRQEKSGWRIWRTDLATPDRSVPITPFGWLSPRVRGTMLFAEKDGVAGIWRIDGAPRRLTDGPAPEASDVYTVSGDRLIYSDTTDPAHPTFSAQNVYGGSKDRLAPLPGIYMDFTFGVDPKSGAIVYTERSDDTDIGLLRLVRN